MKVVTAEMVLSTDLEISLNMTEDKAKVEVQVDMIDAINLVDRNHQDDQAVHITGNRILTIMYSIVICSITIIGLIYLMGSLPLSVLLNYYLKYKH